jgi:hypothetical protein
MHSEAGNLPLVELDQPFHNLIPSRFPPVAVYERIAEGRDELFTAIEEMTNPRVREKERLTRGLAPVDQDQPRFKNWNHAPFVYPNPEGSRFYTADRNVVELADELQTALAISIGKRTDFLRRTAEPSTYLEMRQIVRPVRGTYLDATSWDGMEDRARRLELGKFAVDEKLDGILFRPDERRSARCVVVLKAECLGRPIQGEHFKYMWNGQAINAFFSFRTDTVYDPKLLSSEDELLAA